VPTPFYHLSIAEDLLRNGSLPAGARAFLHAQRSAFLFGNTAPDVQTITGQARFETHFFKLPIREAARPAWDLMLESNPGLEAAPTLPPAQAAFVAGYLCHLQADWFWVLKIFAPVFGPTCSWRSFRHRLYLHNVLRAYLDQKILPGLPSDEGGIVGQAEPSDWLPFVQDNSLCIWRDFLAQQLQPGSVVQTVEVFASRQGIPVEKYQRMLDSDELLDEEIFSRISRQVLEEYRKQLLVENANLIQAFLS
jgi:hypothetical protein